MAKHGGEMVGAVEVTGDSGHDSPSLAESETPCLPSTASSVSKSKPRPTPSKKAAAARRERGPLGRFLSGDEPEDGSSSTSSPASGSEPEAGSRGKRKRKRRKRGGRGVVLSQSDFDWIMIQR